jgi:uncharacterized membrane protein
VGRTSRLAEAFVAALAWLGSLPSAIVFALLAMAELVSDKLPKTPSRTLRWACAPEL